MARQIAGDTRDMVTFELARVAAEAELDLARIRQVKKAMIERVMEASSVPNIFDRAPKKFAGSSPWTISRKAGVASSHLGRKQSTLWLRCRGTNPTDPRSPDAF